MTRAVGSVGPRDDPRIRVDRRHQILCTTARNRSERQQSSIRAIERCSRTTATAGHACFLIVAVTPPDVPLTLTDRNKHPRSVSLRSVSFATLYAPVVLFFQHAVFHRFSSFDDSFSWSSISKADRSNFTDVYATRNDRLFLFPDGRDSRSRFQRKLICITTTYHSISGCHGYYRCCRCCVAAVCSESTHGLSRRPSDGDSRLH